MMPTEEASTAATRLATGVIGPIAVVAALLSALTTFLVLAKLTFVSPTPNVVVTLLAVKKPAVPALFFNRAFEPAGFTLTNRRSACLVGRHS
jgi:two-component system, NtrC family, nitrogen regulation sensor histidine kinase NtrY